MKSTRFWVVASVVAVVLVAWGNSILGVASILGAALTWASLVSDEYSDRQRWDKSPRFIDGELVTPILSPEGKALRKHAFTDQDLDRDPVYLPAYIYRRPDRNPKNPNELDCKNACTSGRLPLLSLQPGKDCSYSHRDIEKAKNLDDLRIHHRCAATPLSVITRPDGKIQWTFDGYPLYYYPKTEHEIEPGWEKVEPAHYNSQGILVNFEGKTLYVRRDANIPLDRSQCRQECLESVIPFSTQFPFDWDGATVPRFMMGMLGNDSHPASKKDSQWEINGQFLYLHKYDINPGDQKAVSASRGYWQTVKRQTPPFRGVVLSGERRRLQLYTYADKLPVYVFDSKYADTRDCSGSCLNDFTPDLKSTSRQSWAGPLDAITVKKNESGREQWAYQGKLLYIPNLNAGKSQKEFDQSAAQLGLTTIVVDDCYSNDTECRKNSKVNLDRVYWLP
jgi:predicted lipoprotein with Yx(FWY)xxD motif